MKSIKTATIDNYEIVTAIYPDTGFIDPESTRIKMLGMIENTDESRAVDKKKKEVSVYILQMNEALKNAKKAKTETEKRKFIDEYREREIQVKQIMEDMKPLADDLMKKKKEIIINNPVYFTTQPGTYLITDDEAAALETKMIEATQNSEVVTKSGEKIVDNRGKIYWVKNNLTWQKTEILKLGVCAPQDGILESDLTEEQKQEISELWRKN
jgi:hypothetical protein